LGKKAISELKATPEYQSLTPGQQRFVDNYVANGHDVVKAYHEAFKCKDEWTSRCASYSLMRQPAVIFVLNLYFGDTPDEAFVNHIWKMIMKRKISQQELNAWRLYADIRRMRHGSVENAIDLAVKLGMTSLSSVGKLPLKKLTEEQRAADPKIEIPGDFLSDF
jgi:hypothetical protein